jgi:hypothetical protein
MMVGTFPPLLTSSKGAKPGNRGGGGVPPLPLVQPGFQPLYGEGGGCPPPLFCETWFPRGGGGRHFLHKSLPTPGVLAKIVTRVRKIHYILNLLKPNKSLSDASTFPFALGDTLLYALRHQELVSLEILNLDLPVLYCTVQYSTYAALLV